VIALRVVESIDFVTARSADLPCDILDHETQPHSSWLLEN
jgi:GMP synthase PP-ATPase subunit